MPDKRLHADSFSALFRPYADVHVSAESLPVSRQSRDGEGAEQSSGLPLAMDVATSQLLGTAFIARGRG